MSQLWLLMVFSVDYIFYSFSFRLLKDLLETVLSEEVDDCTWISKLFVAFFFPFQSMKIRHWVLVVRKRNDDATSCYILPFLLLLIPCMCNLFCFSVLSSDGCLLLFSFASIVTTFSFQQTQWTLSSFCSYWPKWLMYIDYSILRRKMRPVFWT